MLNLRKITQEELNEIIKNHQHYLNKDCDGWEKMQADLSYMDLSYMDLSYANLSYANLFITLLHLFITLYLLFVNDSIKE